jgi:hypothetical protein
MLISLEIGFKVRRYHRNPDLPVGLNDGIRSKNRCKEPTLFYTPMQTKLNLEHFEKGFP